MRDAEHSTLEVNHDPRDAEGLQTYQTYDNPYATHTYTPSISNTKESHNGFHPLVQELGLEGTKSTSFWGGKKKLWYLGGVLTIIILVAVGVGVGVGLAQRKSNDSPANNTEPKSDGLSPTTRLSSVNWTSPAPDRTTQYWVYFQDSASNALYQSRWESKGNKWTVTPITLRDNLGGEESDIKVRADTTIASVIYNRGNTAERRIYFLDDNDSIIELATNTSSEGDGNWTRSPNIRPLVDAYTKNAPNTLPPLTAFWTKSSLIDKGGDIQRGNITIAFIGDDRNMNFCHRDPEWFCRTEPWDTNTPAEGSPMALVSGQPTGQIRALNDMNLYFFSGGSIGESGYWGASWRHDSLVDTFAEPNNKDADLAAFSYGYNFELNQIGEITVFASLPNGGVSISRWTSSGKQASWQLLPPESHPALDGIVKNSPLAANQDRRVYAMAKGSNGTELVEYTTDLGGQWIRVGVVDTTIP